MKIRIHNHHGARGFTVLELLTAIAVMAILVGWGFPSLQTMIRNNQVAAQNAELVSMLNFAKGEAIRRNTDVPVILTATDDGWGAIVEDPAEEADVEGCVPGQLRCATYNRVDLVGLDLPSGDSILTFNNRGYIIDPDQPLTFASGTMFLQHENCEGNRQRTRIDITATGQINSCTLACDDDDTGC